MRVLDSGALPAGGGFGDQAADQSGVRGLLPADTRQRNGSVRAMRVLVASLTGWPNDTHR